jgi:hypothetical protein
MLLSQSLISELKFIGYIERLSNSPKTPEKCKKFSFKEHIQKEFGSMTDSYYQDNDENLRELLEDLIAQVENFENLDDDSQFKYRDSRIER